MTLREGATLALDRILRPPEEVPEPEQLERRATPLPKIPPQLFQREPPEQPFLPAGQGLGGRFPAALFEKPPEQKPPGVPESEEPLEERQVPFIRADDFIEAYYRKSGWPKVNRAIASQEELVLNDQRLSEAVSAYNEAFGAKGELLSAGIKVAQLLPLAGTAVDIKRMSPMEIAISLAIDAAILLPPTVRPTIRGIKAGMRAGKQVAPSVKTALKEEVGAIKVPGGEPLKPKPPKIPKPKVPPEGEGLPRAFIEATESDIVRMEEQLGRQRLIVEKAQKAFEEIIPPELKLKIPKTGQEKLETLVDIEGITPEMVKAVEKLRDELRVLVDLKNAKVGIGEFLAKAKAYRIPKAGKIIPETEVKPPVAEGIPPAKPPKEPLMPIAEKLPEPEPPAFIQKALDLIKATAKERKALEKIKTKARIPKIEAMTEKFEEAKTFEEVRAAKAAFKGKLIPEGADITPLAREFTPEEQALQIKFIRDAPVFARKSATARNTAEAWGNLIEFGKIPTIGERRNLVRAFGRKFEESLPVEDTNAWQRFGDVLMEVMNTQKTTMSMLDLSAGGRQMLFTVPRHPLMSIKNVFLGAKAGLRQKWYEGIVESIAKNRFAPEADAFGLPLTEVTGHILKREEAYLSGWLMKIGKDWGSYSVGKKILSAPLYPVGQVARMSARAFVATLNKQRMDIFTKFAALWEGAVGERELRGMASLIGIMTGRGTLPRRLEPLVTLLNIPMFSPRLQLSRLQYLALPFTLWKYPPMVRRYAIGNIVSFYGTMLSFLGMISLGVKAGGLGDKVGIEIEPRSTDFGKIRVGDTRIDPWGGLQQYARLFARLITGEMKTASGRIMEIDREDELLRFWRTKENPLVGLLHDLFKGETFLGEEVFKEAEDVKEQAFERTAPFFIQDVLDAMKNDGLLGGFVASPGFFGVGILSYPSKAFADWLVAVKKEWTTEEMMKIRPDFNKAETSWLEYSDTPSGRGRDAYLAEHPDIEASLYFWGEVKSLSTPEARDAFNEMVKKYDFPEDIWPIRELEPWEPEDKTEAEIWADLLNMMPKYASDYIQENKEEWQTKDLPSFIPQLEEMKNADISLMARYERATLDTNDKFRHAYRADHPDIDAALLFWRGYKENWSKEALEILRQKADILGIPYDAIPALSRKSGKKAPIQRFEAPVKQFTIP